MSSLLIALLAIGVCFAAMTSLFLWYWMRPDALRKHVAGQFRFDRAFLGASPRIFVQTYILKPVSTALLSAFGFVAFTVTYGYEVSPLGLSPNIEIVLTVVAFALLALVGPIFFIGRVFARWMPYRLQLPGARDLDDRELERWLTRTR